MILFSHWLPVALFSFFPETDENQDLLVVDGMITDQNRVNRIKLSRSMPVGNPLVSKPVKGATVTITDENGIVTSLAESPAWNLLHRFHGNSADVSGVIIHSILK